MQRTIIIISLTLIVLLSIVIMIFKEESRKLDVVVINKDNKDIEKIKQTFLDTLESQKLKYSTLAKEVPKPNINTAENIKEIVENDTDIKDEEIKVINKNSKNIEEIDFDEDIPKIKIEKKKKKNKVVEPTKAVEPDYDENDKLPSLQK